MKKILGGILMLSAAFVIAQTADEIAEFREKLVKSLLNVENGTQCLSNTHYLRLTEELEGCKRSDTRKRRYCIGCYNSLVNDRGREIAKLKAKRVVTECAGCTGNPRFCYNCFPKYH